MNSNSADSAPVEPGMRLGIIKNGNCTFGTGYVSLSRLSCFSPTNHALQLSIGSLLRTVEASGDSGESREMSSFRGGRDPVIPLTGHVTLLHHRNRQSPPQLESPTPERRPIAPTKNLPDLGGLTNREPQQLSCDTRCLFHR